MSGAGIDEDDAIQRIRALVAQSRPAAVAGWPEYWARLTGLPLAETLDALEALVARGELRRQALAGRTMYIADPPHTAMAPR
ncbi:MAG TPA: hypothetical protein VFU78_13135 [Thermomicrobiales bacterium]|jgi:hypothetical protein|nr:hypothetical protein [Thermomicrobiales bacterium]